MAEKPVKIGIVGFGTVGAGVAKIILEKADTIAAKTGLRLQLACAVDLDTTSQRPVTLPDGILTDDINRLLDDDSISIGLELVGGTTIAKDIQLKMITAGKDVVTANKALLAEYGSELFAAAHKNNRCIAFEASCAGSIPIVSALRTSLAANNIQAMYGILNGTCNYILTNMTEKGADFDTVLKEAQQKGYAEADPTLDINGGDSAHKLAILSSLAFGCQISLDDIYVKGIEAISRDDIRFGGEMGYVLKLLAIGQKDIDNNVWLRVHPSFIKNSDRLASVGGPFNAVSVFGDAAGHLMLYGRGAGMMPTASAVVADIIDVALGNSATTFKSLNLKPPAQCNCLIQKIDTLQSRFYIRLMCKDRPGVIAQWSKVLANNKISISGAIQREGRTPDNTVPVVISTHPSPEKNVAAAVEDMAKLESIGAKPVCIRIVDIPED
ncbi:MAG: homoserine dehydrogenase [Sedimentisphaerales bacterium]|nr:homoserine dehydrogenase [Sedimentisphaerales bacterium]